MSEIPEIPFEDRRRLAQKWIKENRMTFHILMENMKIHMGKINGSQQEMNQEIRKLILELAIENV